MTLARQRGCLIKVGVEEFSVCQKQVRSDNEASDFDILGHFGTIFTHNPLLEKNALWPDGRTGGQTLLQRCVDASKKGCQKWGSNPLELLV